MSEIERLTDLSARIGKDPLLIQAAGGNTSIKNDDGTMWIKASGTWLAEAQEKDIFVPVFYQPLLNALRERDARADNGVAFVDQSRNPSGLRPSIETSVHAIFPQKAVVHVHSVDTIALAVRQDAEASLKSKLEGLPWVFVPYIKPGVDLSRSISERLKDDTRVVILGNHGLIVAGDTVNEADALLDDVNARLEVKFSPKTPDYEKLKQLSDEHYMPAEDLISHQVALNSSATARAAKGSLYPDHVIFLGNGAEIYKEGPSVAPIRIVPDAGVLWRRDLNDGAKALSRALSDVLLRIPEDAKINYLSDSEVAELLNWDAEKYRQSLNQERAQ